MKTLAPMLLAATVLGTAAQAASNGIQTYARNGNWSNYAGTSNDGNQFLCGMADSSNTTHIKYSPQTGNVWLMLAKSTWRIPDGTQVPIEIGFDRAGWSIPTTAYGTTQTLPGGYSLSTVTIHIKADSVKDFLDNFKDANKMWLRFGGNEAPWIVDMTGSRETAETFIKCAASVTKPTQPYSSQPSTQPYSTQPTQPYSSTDKQFGGDKFEPDRPKKIPGQPI